MKCFIFFSPYLLLLPNSLLYHVKYLNAKIIKYHILFKFLKKSLMNFYFFPQKFYFVYLNLSGYKMNAWHISCIYLLIIEN